MEVMHVVPTRRSNMEWRSNYKMNPLIEPLGFIGHLYWEYCKPLVFYELGYLFLASVGGQNIISL